MKGNKTYQEQDSIVNPNLDTIGVSGLQLLDIEDEADLIVPVNVKRNSNINARRQEPKSEEHDSLRFKQGFDNIPTRKVKSNYNVNSLEKEAPITFFPTKKKDVNTTWQAVLLLLAFGLLGFIKAFSINRFKQIIKSIFSYHAAEELVREEKVFFHRVNFSLFLLYVISITLLIAGVTTFYFSIEINSAFYIRTAAIVVAIYTIKFVTSFFVLSVFAKNALFNSYIYSVLLYNYLFGVVLLPCLSFIYFSNIPFDSVVKYIIIPCLSLVLVFRLFRLVLIGRQNNFLISYIILYICTLEILPLVVLSKIFIFK